MNESPRNSLGTLEMAIGQMVQFAYENPHLFELMRTSSLQETFSSSHWGGKHMEFKSLLESIIRKGIRQEELTDVHPELTARFIPGLVRSVMIDTAPSVDRKTLTAH
ncbi:MAG TPA: hypothetical protein VKA69_08895, partial [Desulfobacteria bacterium]|nr:hypothetical protein [Desulfobacteria bacterium]